MPALRWRELRRHRLSPLLSAFALLAIGLVATAASETAANGEIAVGLFSAATPGGLLPDGWQPLVFPKIPRHTVYSLVEDGDRVVVEAVSDASASGLVRRIEIDPKELPILEWRWRVSNLIANSDVRRKEGDDYPARIYVTFAYDPDKLSFAQWAKYQAARAYYGEYPPTGAIDYIWASHAPLGTSVPNPYTDRTQMIVVESGAAKLGEWVSERRNVYEDFRNAFGEKPPEISGVGIMTDTDDTGASATAYYGDIVFRRGKAR